MATNGISAKGVFWKQNSTYMKMHLKWAMAALFILGIYLAACGSKDKDLETGEQVYTQYCALCHGPDGKLEMNGAKDITISELTLEDRMTLIKEGRNLMTPFNGILNDDEIRAVAKYSMTLGQ